MTYDFTTMPDRHGKDSIAADAFPNPFIDVPKGKTRDGFDRIPMWIADMNFATCPTVTDAVRKRIEHPIFGYFLPSEDCFKAILYWQREANHVEKLSWLDIGYENGVLGGITSALHILASPGEPVLIHSPTYNGFSMQLERNGYPAVLSPLKRDKDDVWRMDFEDMERKIKEYHIHTALFCSPHNPTGRVWEKWELEKAMEIFRRNDVYVISDEIWSDLTLFGHQHIPTQSVSEDAQNRTVAFYAPSKTFNLAGLVEAYSIIYNPYLRDRMRNYEALCHYNDMNVLTMHALVGAYRPEGREWLNQLKKVLESNISYGVRFIREHFEGVHVSLPQGTYCILLDCEGWCRKHHKSIEELAELCVEVGIIVRDGTPCHLPYGIRMNLALPHHKVVEAFDRLEKYVF